MKIIKKSLSIILVLVMALTMVNTVIAETTEIIDVSLVSDTAVENFEASLQSSQSISSGTVYTIKNAGSGKYLNVYGATDANGTNVVQWTKDGSTEQKFKIVYDSSTNSYKIYAMCSSSGTNRVLDVYRGSSALADGQNVDIWTPDDSLAQNMYISTGSTAGNYRIAMKGNQNLYITAKDNSNGTSSGKTSASTGNVFLADYENSLYQQWIIEPVDEIVAATPSGSLDVVNDTKISGWAWRKDIPNDSINVHIYLKNTTTGNTYVRQATANNYRSDLYKLGYGDGYHGFNYEIDWNDYPIGIYSVSVYAIGYNGNNPMIGSCPKTYNHSVITNQRYSDSAVELVAMYSENYISTDVELELEIYEDYYQTSTQIYFEHRGYTLICTAESPDIAGQILVDAYDIYHEDKDGNTIRTFDCTFENNPDNDYQICNITKENSTTVVYSINNTNYSRVDLQLTDFPGSTTYIKSGIKLY